MSKKVTMHSGRAHADGKTFDPKHNDRSFDVRQADNSLGKYQIQSRQKEQF